jgi:hypothetical protein
MGNEEALYTYGFCVFSLMSFSLAAAGLGMKNNSRKDVGLSVLDVDVERQAKSNTFGCDDFELLLRSCTNVGENF